MAADTGLKWRPPSHSPPRECVDRRGRRPEAAGLKAGPLAVRMGNVYTSSIRIRERTMPKEAMFTMKLETELRDAFMAAAANS